MSAAKYMSSWSTPAECAAPAPAPRPVINARNATTHGLFARDVVLPSLGEDPGGYNEVYLDLCMQINPTNLLERHYVEKIAAASWRLRRLHRWQAQLFEDARLTEDERLSKLDKVLRHETALHRQIDTAIKMLSKHVPRLLTARARQEALTEMEQTDRACQDDADIAAEIETKTREKLRFRPWPADFEMEKLDNLAPLPKPPATTPPTEEVEEEDELDDEEWEEAQRLENEQWDKELAETRAKTQEEMNRWYQRPRFENEGYQICKNETADPPNPSFRKDPSEAGR